ncbi:type III-B CRISPR module-associated Cmr3 family protein [uncultured Cohaesibacter sp.]|uniref:type III-B CRISPR module-associated Cmr3 family protein n=1 Tax=uncultured Cohaesibacter sp. TaxID=1002546 RepID=UPI002AA942CE|nr:type III-B CRISPR module-associated Cmr3 family protein [uncultured Cohaesibacter sp.]
MTIKSLYLESIDTFMFRDGRPFNQVDAGASEASSVFPPWPPSIVGAVRAYLWRSVLSGQWDESKLGDGTNWQSGATLASLDFGAPLILHHQKPVFPVPLHVVEGSLNNESEGEGKSFTHLRPSETNFATDLDEVPLPTHENRALKHVKTLSDRWLTKEGMKKVLEGKAAELSEDGDLIAKSYLWSEEARVGIGIDPSTRMTSDGRLYMATHIRLNNNVSLAVNLNGWTDTKNQAAPSLQPVAGEHRMGEIRAEKDPIELPSIDLSERQNTYCLIAISPVVPDPQKGFSISGLDSEKILSACLGKPVSIGGWNSAQKRPIALRQCIPAGSVWFMKGNPPINGGKIGLAQKWGFGQVLVGRN